MRSFLYDALALLAMIAGVTGTFLMLVGFAA